MKKEALIFNIGVGHRKVMMINNIAPDCKFV